MNQDRELLRQIEMLNQNISNLTRVITELISVEEARTSKKRVKPAPVPLTEEEVVTLKSSFDLMYTRWDSGSEHEVRSDLEAMPFDQLRRFADANNLTIGKKATKDSVLRAVLTRFREKKMLFKGVTSNSKGTVG